MSDDGELDLVFQSSATILSRFLDIFRENELAYTADDKGITVAVWGSPMFSGCMTGVYIRPDKRGSPSAYRAIIEALRMLFTRVKVVVGVTQQKHLLSVHDRLGYNVVGCIPGLWDGKDAWVITLTSEDLENAISRKHRPTREWSSDERGQSNRVTH
jgi:hypothetical protein